MSDAPTPFPSSGMIDMLVCRTRGFRYHFDSWFIGGIGSHDEGQFRLIATAAKRGKIGKMPCAVDAEARVSDSYREGLF